MLAQMPAENTEIITVAHPCDCGATIAVDPLAGGVCEQCGQFCPADALAGSDSGYFGDELGAEFDGLLDPEPDPLIGARLHHFQIMSILGTGGMGTVYRALDDSLHRYVALKVITRGAAGQDGPNVARVLQEARAQARVNHPNVVHIYYVSQDEENPFLAMELIHGPTLADRLRDGPLPYGETVEIAMQIADALRQSAQYDIVHGDIKPGNILLCDEDKVKLSDFGLARRLSVAEDDPEQIAGTPNYLSPEACRGEPTDIRSDMYALGVMLFEMTFGRLPYSFDHSGAAARIRAHCHAKIEFPDEWPAHIPEQWAGVLGRLLAKDPEQRYWSYEPLLSDLRALKPVSRPAAGRIVRGLAWMIDLLFAAALQRFLVGLVTEGAVGEYLSLNPALNLFASLVGFIAPVLVMFLAARWKRTIGKDLLQICVVGRHGLPPRSSQLALRTVLPMLPLWQFAIQTVCAAAGVGILGKLAGVAALLGLSADVLTSLVRRDRRSLHDLLLDTRVVLEAGPSSGSPGGFHNV